MPMNRVRLTDKFIAALEPDRRVVDYPDEITPGLVLRVTPAGVKGWGFRFRNAKGRPTRKALGRYPQLKLADARDAVAKLRAQIREGVDITAPRREDGVLFEDVVDRWERRQCSLGVRSVKETRRIIDLHVTPDLGARNVATIRRRDVIEILERLRDQGAKAAKGGDRSPRRRARAGLGAQVNRVQRAISGVLSYAVDADLIEVNPIVGLKPQVREAERERVLSLDELATVWAAADELSATARDLVRLLILTGQRREEVTGMAWAELDFNRTTGEWTAGGLWTIPAERSKSKREHAVPLGRATREMIGAQSTGARGDFIFSATEGEASFAGWRRAAVKLSADAALDEPWVIHDLRRSFATGLGEALNVDESVISRLLGHSAKARMGVTARYERSERLEVMRAAVDAWADAVAQRVASRHGGNVVAFVPERARA